MRPLSSWQLTFWQDNFDSTVYIYVIYEFPAVIFGKNLFVALPNRSIIVNCYIVKKWVKNAIVPLTGMKKKR